MLFDLLKLFIKFCWFKDTETACCLIITLSYWLDESDTIQLRDYFEALRECNQIA